MPASHPSLSPSGIRELYPVVFNLCVRMRLDPDDAADATQEILIKAIKSFAGFRAESSLKTWALRIARNHVLSMARKGPHICFEQYEDEATAHLTEEARRLHCDATIESERAAAIEDLKISCTTALLQCLDPLDRLCFVLHAFFGLSSPECAEIAGLRAEAYRQRVSRARKALANFLQKHCEAAGGSTCACDARLGYAQSKNRLRPDRPFHAMRIAGAEVTLAVEDAMEELDAVSSFYRSQAPLLPGDADGRVATLLSLARAVVDPDLGS